MKQHPELVVIPLGTVALAYAAIGVFGLFIGGFIIGVFCLLAYLGQRDTEKDLRSIEKRRRRFVLLPIAEVKHRLWKRIYSSAYYQYWDKEIPPDIKVVISKMDSDTAELFQKFRRIIVLDDFVSDSADEINCVEYSSELAEQFQVPEGVIPVGLSYGEYSKTMIVLDVNTGIVKTLLIKQNKNKLAYDMIGEWPSIFHCILWNLREHKIKSYD
ncbi:MAG: hypothetical protein J7L73_09725 [Anaerolineales bacterium]|nr:hypothetical protein [Anaerolineales bacterium]